MNYEAAAAAADNCATQNECSVTVGATDASGDSAATAATVTIAVTNVNEAPTFTARASGVITGIASPMTIMRDENMTALADAGSEDDVTYAATDPEGLNVNLMLMGSDADMFALSNTGVLSFKKEKDREMPTDANRDNVYELTVRASDGTLHTDRMVMVTVTNENEAPVVGASGLSVSGPTAVSYAENGTDAVATYMASGPMSDMATWMLEGDDAGDFRISNGGMLSFRSSPDYESPDDENMDNMYEVTVKASDGTNMDTLDVMVTVTDEDDMSDQDELLTRYDENENGHIDRSEAVQAVLDYQNGMLSRADAVSVILLYHGNN